MLGATLPTDVAAFGQASAAALIIAVYLVVGEPFVGLVAHRRFEHLAERSPGARRWLYSRLLILEWGLVALVVAVVLISADLGVLDLGVRGPASSTAWVITVAVAALGAAMLLVTARLASRMQGSADEVERLVGSEHVVLMLPRTARERRLFACVAITAGIAEEVVYRGFLLLVASAVMPSLPLAGTVAIIVVVFGLAHAYQGASGVVLSTVIGGILAGLYLLTGSLLAPVVLHICIDLRALLLGRVVVGRSRRRSVRRESPSDRPGR